MLIKGALETHLLIPFWQRTNIFPSTIGVISEIVSIRLQGGSLSHEEFIGKT